MNCEICQDSGWEITASGAKRCECRPKPQAQPKGRPITPDVLEMALKTLHAMSFFPTERAAQMLIGNELRVMCPSVEALQYTVHLAVRKFRTWDKCGLEGLRQALCHRFQPADGDEAGPTEMYPDGLPSETGHDPLALPPGAVKALPPGPQREAEDRQLRGRMAKLETKRKKAAPTTNPNYKPITQTEIDRAVQELREKRARAEVGQGGDAA